MSKEGYMERQIRKMIEDAKEIGKQANKFSRITQLQKAIIHDYENLIEDWINLDPSLEEHYSSTLELIKKKTTELDEFIAAEAQDIEG